MKHFALILMCMFAITAAEARGVFAQNQTPVNAEPVAQELSKLPASDLVVYINARRIMNEALPGLIPARQYAMMLASLKEMKQHTGINVSELRYMAMALRFKTPLATKLTVPEFLFVTNGDFDAENFLSHLQSGSNGELRQEKYGAKDIYVTKLDMLAKSASANPMLAASMSEMAATAIDAHTLAFGTAAYLRTAINAAEGRGLIKPELVSLVLRDPNVLISMAGLSIVPPPMLRAASFAENNERALSAPGDFYMAIAMREKAFELSMFLQTDNAQQAETISKALRKASQEMRTSAPNDDARDMFDTLMVTAQNDQVLLQTSVRQAALTALIEPLFRTPTQSHRATHLPRRPPRRANRTRRRN